MAQKFNAPFGSGGKTVTKPIANQVNGKEAGAHSPGMMAEDQAPEQVAEEHGPPVEVHHTHESEMGSHHVHSVHGDGFEHHSDHGSADEAIEHHKKLMGGAPAEHESGHDEEEPWGK